MTTPSQTWVALSHGRPEDVSDDELALAYAEVNHTIHGLKRMGRAEGMTELTSWSKAIEEIQSDRQAANRPELPTSVSIVVHSGQVSFYMGPGPPWTAGPSEQTEQLRKQLEAVYETTTMVKR